MALTIEDGSIVAGADSYVALADYQSYGADRGWTLSGADATDEVNLRRAFDALNRRWSYIGTRVRYDQPGEFPRYFQSHYTRGTFYGQVSLYTRFEDMPSADEIPQEVLKAQKELAFLIQGGLDPFETVTGSVKRERNKAGPVETETEYTGGKSTARIVAVEGLLRRYTGAGPNQKRLVRS